MKTKTHKFLLTVESESTRKAVEIRILGIFARRSPDGCKFGLHKKSPKLATRKPEKKIQFTLTIKPKGNLAPVGESQISRTYYVHKEIPNPIYKK